VNENLDLLDDIGLVLSVFVLLFISYFHLRNLNDERTWDRKMGASLVIWLLLYFILRRVQEISPSMGIDDPAVSSFIVEITAYSSQLNFYYIHLFLMLLALASSSWCLHTSTARPFSPTPTLTTIRCCCPVS
jgi:hypothetical protein